MRKLPRAPIMTQTRKMTSTSEEKSQDNPLTYTKAKNTERQSTLFMVTAPYSSENVSDADFVFFLVAKMIADTASLEFVARGRAINEMKKEGMLVASEKLFTASTSGSAKTAAI